MPSYIIITPTQNALSASQPFSPLDLSNPHPDLLLIEGENSIGINQVRLINKFTQMPPFKSTSQVIFIKEAFKLTIPAQNALLKILEEPPPYTLLILAVENRDQLLETVLSRGLIFTKTYHQPTSIPKETNRLLQQITQSRVGERLNLSKPFTQSKASAMDICLNLTHTIRQQNLRYPSVKTAHNLQILAQSLNRLHANANPSLTLEDLFIKLR